MFEKQNDKRPDKGLPSYIHFPHAQNCANMIVIVVADNTIIAQGGKKLYTL